MREKIIYQILAGVNKMIIIFCSERMMYLKFCIELLKDVSYFFEEGVLGLSAPWGFL